MRRIAIITDAYVRDAQVFSKNPDIMCNDENWEDYFTDVKNPCLYIGIFESADEDEIAFKASNSAGVHHDSITLIKFGEAADKTKNEAYICPVCENKDHSDEAEVCINCGNDIPVHKIYYYGTNILR